MAAGLVSFRVYEVTFTAHGATLFGRAMLVL